MVFVSAEHIMFTMMRNVDGIGLDRRITKSRYTESPQGPGLMMAVLCSTGTTLYCNTATPTTWIIKTQISVDATQIYNVDVDNLFIPSLSPTLSILL